MNLLCILSLPSAIAIIISNDLHILAFCFAKTRTVKEIARELDVTPSTYFRKNVIGRLVERKLLLERKADRVASYQSNPELVKCQP